ncbi:MAG: hypothetical protein NC305_16855 [Lachnospiraceae bacterium]|nr:hypothetical protein [Butyrivibrio sp.]MCM1412194.1 hypothetical protein [Lachnospiraceae bacterium]
MVNDIWMKVAHFLGALNGENKNRKSYVSTPEYEKAEQTWIEKEKEWEKFLDSLSAENREQAEDMKECLEIFASEQERRSYMQGYVDCVQILYHMGLLKESEGLKWAEKMDLR